MPSNKELDLWQLSIELTVEIYKMTNSFPQNEMTLMVSQMRQASISISSKISLGSSFKKKEFARYILMSIDALTQLESLIFIAERLGYIKDLTILEKTKDVKSKSFELIKILNEKK